MKTVKWHIESSCLGDFCLPSCPWSYRCSSKCYSHERCPRDFGRWGFGGNKWVQACLSSLFTTGYLLANSSDLLLPRKAHPTAEGKMKVDLCRLPSPLLPGLTNLVIHGTVPSLLWFSQGQGQRRASPQWYWTGQKANSKKYQLPVTDVSWYQPHSDVIHQGYQVVAHQHVAF